METNWTQQPQCLAEVTETKKKKNRFIYEKENEVYMVLKQFMTLPDLQWVGHWRLWETDKRTVMLKRRRRKQAYVFFKNYFTGSL